MTLKPGTNLGELNHLPCLLKCGASALPALGWAGLPAGQALRCPHRYSSLPLVSLKTREMGLQTRARQILTDSY